MSINSKENEAQIWVETGRLSGVRRNRAPEIRKKFKMTREKTRGIVMRNEKKRKKAHENKGSGRRAREGG